MKAISRKNLVLLFVAFAGMACSFFVFKTFCHARYFNDEAEAFTAALAMKNGFKAYSDIFLHHGPVIYMLCQFWNALFSPVTVEGYRLLQYVIYMMAGFSIALSPLFRGRRPIGWICAASFMFIVSSVCYAWFGHMLLYHNIIGALTVIALYCVLLPGMLNYDVGNKSSFIGILSLVLIPVTSMSFFLCALFAALVLIVLWHMDGVTWPVMVRRIAWPLLSVVSVVVVWLAMFGSFVGFIDEYIYMNLFIFSRYIDMPSMGVLTPVADMFSLSTLKGICSLDFNKTSLLSMILSLSVLIVYSWNARRKSRDCIRGRLLLLASIILLVLSVMYLHPGGNSGWRAAGLYITVLSILPFAFSLAMRIDRMLFRAGAAGALAVSFLLIGLSADKSINYRLFVRNIRLDQPYANVKHIVDLVTDEDDRIASFFFHPGMYYYINRLPARPNFFYLPFQAEWEKAPLIMDKSSTAASLLAALPKVVYRDHWVVWGKYDTRIYAADIDRVLAENYVELDRRHWGNIFIRQDVYSEYRAQLLDSYASADGETIMNRCSGVKHGFLRLSDGDICEVTISDIPQVVSALQMQFETNDKAKISIVMYRNGVEIVQRSFAEGSASAAKTIVIPKEAREKGDVTLRISVVSVGSSQVVDISACIQRHKSIKCVINEVEHDVSPHFNYVCSY